MAEHTPTPWQVTEHDNGLVVRTTDLAGRPIASLWLNGESPQVNAAFIVKAVNNHDELTRAVDVLEANARVQAKLLADTGRQRDALVKALKEILKHMDGNGMQDWPIAKKARAALAVVEHGEK
jgi:hypothetical protein